MRTDERNTTTGSYPLWRVIETLRTINATSTTIDLLQYIINEACFITGIEKATALLWDGESGCYRLKATTHLVNEHERQITLTRDEAFARYLNDVHAIYEGIYIIKNAAGRRAEDKIRFLGIPRSMVVMPIPLDGDVEGFLVFDNMSSTDAFRPDELHVLNLLREPFISALIKIKMIDQLQGLNRRKSDFLQLVAHDIRNPLQAILGYSDMLLQEEREFEPVKVRRDASIIHASATRIMHLVSRLLDIALIDAKAEFRLDPDDLFQVIGDTVDAMSIVAMRKNISIVGPERVDLPQLHFNRPAIHQVLENLLSNAIKYTENGGRITISVEKRTHEIVTHIRDTGLGLTTDDLLYVFRHIKRLSARPTANESSIGLGLVLVKKIIDKHRGRIWVDSVKGEGSCFSFALPLHNMRTLDNKGI